MGDTIGFIGLGQMGEPMVRNLMQAGFKLRIYNRTPEKAAALAGEGASAVSRPADAVERAESRSVWWRTTRLWKKSSPARVVLARRSAKAGFMSP
ncbi:MAG TPA: NAD(P)-binding domain-containing protein [Burkholderiales bacterium]|nr:NAD(P)-binding domain-containing protein [Burkholderiales bacterium]